MFFLLFSSEEDQLPMGSTHDCYGIYTSLGPYLIDVAIETDGPVAIVNKTVAVDIIVERAAALNISAGKFFASITPKKGS